MVCSKLQAFSWYQRASDAGDADGTYHLALCALLLPDTLGWLFTNWTVANEPRNQLPLVCIIHVACRIFQPMALGFFISIWWICFRVDWQHQFRCHMLWPIHYITPHLFQVIVMLAVYQLALAPLWQNDRWKPWSCTKKVPGWWQLKYFLFSPR